MRITEGTYVRSGEKFRKVDNWTSRKEAHREMSEPWKGSTWFKCKEDSGVGGEEAARSGSLMSLICSPGCYGETPTLSSERREEHQANSDKISFLVYRP